MKKNNSILFLLLIGTFLTTQAQTPTWSNKIAAIFYNNCTSCHRDGGIGTFPIITYSDAVSHSLTIKDKVQSKLMPPWKPDPTYKHFKDERFLTTTEIADIADWVDNGTPVGDLSSAPTPPVFPVGSQMTAIDQTLTLPRFTVTSSVDQYRSFVIHSGISVDKYLNQIEYLPGNGSIVHHIVLYKDPSNYSDSLDHLDTIPGFDSYGSVAVSPNATFLGAWAPGSGIFNIPSNFGIKVDANADYVIEIHYAPGSAGQSDSSVLNLKYTTDPMVREVYIDAILNYFTSLTNGPINIAPNTQKMYYEDEFIPLGYDFSILAVFPHMHKVGTSFKIWDYVPATHDTVPIINIPKWDFHWQGFYTLQKMMKVPGQTHLQAKALYDNTTANHDNPFSPPQWITSGEHTTQEMMLAFFAYTQYQLGDENIILDSAVLYAGIQKISTETVAISIFPNPASTQLSIQIEALQSGSYQFDFINSQGQQVKSFKQSVLDHTPTHIPVDISDLPAGVYSVSVVNTSGERQMMRFVKM